MSAEPEGQAGWILAGRYELQERIGFGGLGVVYRGWDPVLERNVAVKLLNQVAGTDLSPTRRLAHEAQATAGLISPHIVQVYDFGYHDEQPFLVMEYMPNGTLADLIAVEGRLSPERIADIGRQIAAGLAVAHARGLVHRDVTQRNVLVAANGQLKVADFGIVKDLHDDLQLTQSGIALGTAHAMAPEQVRGQTVTPATDVYGLGVLLYELATGQPPFKADSSMGVVLKHLDEVPRSPREMDPNLPIWLEQIILRALAKDPLARFPDAAVMEAALAVGVTTGAIPIVSAQPQATRPESAPPWWPTMLVQTRQIASRAERWSTAAARTTAVRARHTAGVGVQAARVGSDRLRDRLAPARRALAPVLARLTTALSPLLPAARRWLNWAVARATAGGQAAGAALRRGWAGARAEVGRRWEAAQPALAEWRRWPVPLAVCLGLWVGFLIGFPAGLRWAPALGGSPAVSPTALAAPPTAPATAATTRPATATPAPAVPARQALPGGGSRVDLESAVFTGGFRRPDSNPYIDSTGDRRPATWIYGGRSRYPAMTARFRLDSAAPADTRLTIVGLNHEGAAPMPIRVTINDVVIFEGAAPLPAGRWGEATWRVPPGALRVGENQVTIRSLAPDDNLHAIPFLMLDRARLDLPASS